MGKLRIVCVGKSKEKWLIEGINQFSQKIQRYCDFDIVEINDRQIKNKDINFMVKQESEELRKKLDSTMQNIYCDIKGTIFSTEKLAALMEKKMEEGSAHFQFFIGGAYGITEQLSKMFDHKISFSPMTFNHQIFKLLLVEQLYRCQTIIAGHPYHHS